MIGGYVAVTTERLPDGEYRHRCYRTTDGRDRLLLGCRHLSPSSAIAHSKTLAAADISPLRDPAEPSYPSSALPQRAAQVDGSAGPLRSGSRPVG